MSVRCGASHACLPVWPSLETAAVTVTRWQVCCYDVFHQDHVAGPLNTVLSPHRVEVLRDAGRGGTSSRGRVSVICEMLARHRRPVRRCPNSRLTVLQLIRNTNRGVSHPAGRWKPRPGNPWLVGESQIPRQVRRALLWGAPKATRRSVHTPSTSSHASRLRTVKPGRTRTTANRPGRANLYGRESAWPPQLGLTGHPPVLHHAAAPPGCRPNRPTPRNNVATTWAGPCSFVGAVLMTRPSRSPRPPRARAGPASHRPRTAPWSGPERPLGGGPRSSPTTATPARTSPPGPGLRLKPGPASPRYRRGGLVITHGTADNTVHGLPHPGNGQASAPATPPAWSWPRSGWRCGCGPGPARTGNPQVPTACPCVQYPSPVIPS